MYNRFIAVGYITKEPKLDFIPTTGSPVCNFGFVTNRKYGDKEEQFWVEVVAFGKLAEVVSQFLKGYLVLIEGRLITKSDIKYGQRTRVIAEKIRLLRKKENEAEICAEVPEEITTQEPF